MNKLKKIKIERHWCMPNHKTFEMPPVKKLIEEEMNGEYVDPFPHPFKKDAIKYLRSFKDNSVDRLVFDPPYSQYQLNLMYKGFGKYFHNSPDKDPDKRITKYWTNCKKEIERITKTEATIISFGWNTSGIGKKYGFKIEKILILVHGGRHNDTLVTVEKKK